MFRSISIAASAAGLLAIGALSAVAANSHGAAVTDLAQNTALIGESKGDAVSTLANSARDSNTTETSAPTVDQATDTATAAADADKDAHGDAVSAVAKSDATAAHTMGAKKVNHGGAVSLVAKARN